MRTKPFWLRPKWVFGHVLCLTLIVLFVNLGFWQLRRLDEKQARNALIHERQDSAPVSLDDALADGPDAARYRRVVVTGRWDPAATVLVRSRSLAEKPGYHVVTPLVDGDEGVLVNRGFAPLLVDGEERVLEEVRPLDPGIVEIEGIVLASEERRGIGPRDPAGETLTIVSRIDVDRLQEQVDHDLAPVYVQQTSPRPDGADLPIVLPAPDSDEGPHLGYAVQWFIFATVGAVGWPLLLRKTAREDRAHDREDADRTGTSG